jgi:hypothetical protein
LEVEVAQLFERVKANASINGDGKIVIGEALPGFTVPDEIADDYFPRGDQPYLLEGPNNQYELGSLCVNAEGYVAIVPPNETWRTVTDTNVNNGSGFGAGTTNLIFSIPATALNCLVSGMSDYSARRTFASGDSMAGGDNAQVLRGMPKGVALGVDSTVQAPSSVAVGYDARVYDLVAMSRLAQAIQANPEGAMPNVGGLGGVAIGAYAAAQMGGIAIGADAFASPLSISIGANAVGRAIGCTIIGNMTGATTPGQTVFSNFFGSYDSSIIGVWFPDDETGVSNARKISDLTGRPLSLSNPDTFTQMAMPGVVEVTGFFSVQGYIPPPNIDPENENPVDPSTFVSDSVRLFDIKYRYFIGDGAIKNIGTVQITQTYEKLGGSPLNNITVSIQDGTPAITCAAGPSTVAYFYLDVRFRPAMYDLVSLNMISQAEFASAPGGGKVEV